MILGTANGVSIDPLIFNGDPQPAYNFTVCINPTFVTKVSTTQCNIIAINENTNQTALLELTLRIDTCKLKI